MSLNRSPVRLRIEYLGYFKPAKLNPSKSIEILADIHGTRTL
jgi:hypothetical protein